MIHRPAVLRAIKGKPREEQIEFLAKIGFNEQQAGDFIDDYEQRAIKVREAMETTGKFSESETFKQLTERLRGTIYGSESNGKMSGL